MIQFFHIVVSLIMPMAVVAWGEYGHEIVANVAWHRLSDTAREAVTDLLNMTNATLIVETGSPLAAVANWADRVRYFMPWSGGLHYIDIRDDSIAGGCHYRSHHHQGEMMTASNSTKSMIMPCDFDYERDCPNDYCVAGAILNYSSQLIKKNELATDERQGHSSLRPNRQTDVATSTRDALMFLIQ